MIAFIVTDEREQRPTLAGLARTDDRGGRRVLLADDDAAVRAAVGRVLTAAGFEVTRVEDGTAAIEALKQDQFDVILTDVNMPGSTGVDLLRLVRTYDMDVPVLLMSGAPDVDTALEAIELGAHRYLKKPLNTDDLLKTVERAARLRRLANMKREAMAVLGRGAEPPGDLAGAGVALDHALETLWIAFQPIVDVERRRVLAYEALMRSESAVLPHPGAILEAAERLDRLRDVGRRVRDVVAAQMAAAPDDRMIFMNLHARDLLDPMLAAHDSALSRFAHRVVLEITERDALDLVKDITGRLSVLRYMGYRIAVDDLGAGYAGLTSFARLEPEFVKLDMSLVRGVHTSEIRQKLVGSMVSVCKELQMSIIAEGVEEASELHALRRLGCELVQGYLFARPARGFPDVAWPDRS